MEAATDRLHADYAAGPAALAADAQAAWNAWRLAHKRELIGPAGKAHDKLKATQKATAKTAKRLRAELGDRFITGTIDREAAIRQWDHRRRKSRQGERSHA